MIIPGEFTVIDSKWHTTRGAGLFLYLQLERPRKGLPSCGHRSRGPDGV